jgi:hypothetical protein
MKSGSRASSKPWDEVKRFSKAVAQHMARVMPDRLSAEPSTVAAFLRPARSGMGVSMPIAWDELKEIGAADQWTIKNAAHRQDTLGPDPRAGLFSLPAGHNRGDAPRGRDALGRASRTVCAMRKRDRRQIIIPAGAKATQETCFNSSRLTMPVWLVNASECPWLCCCDTPLI